MSEQCCIIIGASHAAGQLAPSLRQEGWQGRIIIIGDEPYLPYNRPPLSKTFLAGDKSSDELLIRPAASYERVDIEFKLGLRVLSIDRHNKVVELDNGETLSYTKLALTTGSRVRTMALPGSDLKGIFYLRSIQDVDNIRPYVKAGNKALVVGGGYIGLETAAMLSALGMNVTILEMSERILNRVTAPEISEFYTRIHAEEEVNIVTSAMVSGFEGETCVNEVLCADGSCFEADLVIMGIGILPNVELAEAAGLEVNNGIVVDAHCCTLDSDIVAAGDCARHYNAIYKLHMRLESVQNAVDQAKVAAATVCGKVKEYNALPWFWSDQYDVKLQIAGLSQGYDELLLRGEINQGRKFAAFYLKEGKVIAVDAVNSPQEFMLGKRIIIGKTVVDKERLVDLNVPMKDLLT